MSKTWRHDDKYADKYAKDELPKRGRGRQRQITAKAVRRDDPDLRRMGKALIAWALAEAEAQAEQQKHKSSARPRREGGK